jgi:DNA-binding Lrp family transcriptional regulator
MMLEELNMKILRVLLEDGRASFREIARKVGVSTPTVSSRVRELEALGVLGGYRALVRPEKLGGTALFVRIRVSPEAVDEVVEQLTAREEVREVHLVSRFNLLIRATFFDSEEMRSFLEWISTLQGVVEYEEFPLIRAYKEESPALLREGASLAINCFYCGRRITEKPIRLRLDDRTHYLCCTSCAELYREKYEKIKTGAMGRAKV